MSVDRLRYSQLRAPLGDDFAAFRAIYEEALPARERKGANTLEDMCASKDYRVVVAKTRDEVVGFFVVFVGRSMALLEYMAVRKALRGAGYGALLYEQARKQAGSRLALLLEVDSDRESSADRELRTRRIRFYRRLGCRVIDGLSYILPLPGVGPPPLMDLMVDGAAEDVLPKSVVSTWLREIYTRVYQCKEDDPRLTAMIASLGSHARLT